MNNLLVTIITNKFLVPLVPVLIGMIRNWGLLFIPGKWIPGVLALLGALVGILESQMGLPVTDLEMAAFGAWEGALAGLAATGIHQLYKKIKEAKKS